MNGCQSAREFAHQSLKCEPPRKQRAVTQMRKNTIWSSKVSHVGEISVRRPLPIAKAQSIGPFVLFDHFGPVPAPSRELGAHPHSGIEVMTYLIEGANEHTDSLGNVGQIESGGAQWMRAGRGILHAERNLLDRATTMHGLQIWAKLPIEEQDSAPQYSAFQSEEMVELQSKGIKIRLLAGELEALSGPMKLASPALMAHVQINAGATFEFTFPEAAHEYAFYVIQAGEPIELDNSARIAHGDMIRFEAGAQKALLSNSSNDLAQIFILGGEPILTSLHFSGGFVLDSEASIETAYTRYRTGEMGRLDGVPF